MKKERFVDWWKQDKRYMTLLKAVLMALDDTAVTGNEGIVAHNVEQSIANLCALACRSMQETDKQIIEIMASKAH